MNNKVLMVYLDDFRAEIVIVVVLVEGQGNDMQMTPEVKWSAVMLRLKVGDCMLSIDLHLY